MVRQGFGQFDKSKTVAGQPKKDKPMESPVAGGAVDGKAKNEKTDSAKVAGIEIDEGNFKGVGHACVFDGSLHAAAAAAAAAAPPGSNGEPRQPIEPSVAEKEANGKAKKSADEKTDKMNCKIKIGKGDFQGIGHGCVFAGGLHVG